MPWVLFACAPPDRPAELDLELPAAVRALLVPDTVRSASLHPGVTYRYLWSPSGPWAVHLIQARIGRCDLGVSVLRPEARMGGDAGRAPVSEMTRGATARVLAAVNADFFTPQGTALGVEIVAGSVVSAVARPTFAWKSGQAPWMGTAAPEAGGVRVGWWVDVSGDGATEAVGGFPDLIDRGRRVGDLEVTARPTFAAARHPRSAIGYDEESGDLWIVVVDGRQPPHSVGMSLPELADLLEALGAEEAINLDGGGSTALVVGGAPINRPSDAAGERAVVNALALILHPTGCRAVTGS